MENERAYLEYCTKLNIFMLKVITLITSLVYIGYLVKESLQLAEKTEAARKIYMAFFLTLAIGHLFFFVFYIVSEKFLALSIFRVINGLFVSSYLLCNGVLALYDLHHGAYPLSFAIPLLVVAFFIRGNVLLMLGMFFLASLLFVAGIVYFDTVGPDLNWIYNAIIYFAVATILTIISNSKERTYFFSSKALEDKHLLLEKSNLQLRNLKEVAESANLAKSEFLANMNHEIRTPLHNIQGFLELFTLTPLNPEQEEYIRILSKNSANLLEIANDVLDFSKIESGKLELDRKEFVLHEEIVPLIETFYTRAKERNIALYSFVDPTVPQKLVGDQLRIKQVVSNLLSNAVKFTEPGGTIYIDIKRLANIENRISLLFSVKDTGIGIPRYKQKEIFEPFMQEHSSITGQYGGTGLGLSISRKLVDLMGGILRLDSAKGEGARFYFDVDLELAESRFEKARSISGEGKKALVVATDDGYELERLIVKYLEAFGFEVSILEEKRFLKDKSEYNLLVYSSREDLDECCADNSEKKLLVEPLRYELPPLGKGCCPVVRQPLCASSFVKALTSLEKKEKREASPQLLDVQKFQKRYNARILIAEDNEESRQLMVLMLGKSGLQIETAANGLEAINKLIEHRYDLAIIDENMPVYNGTEVIWFLLEHEKKNNIDHTPCIALTATATKDSREKFISAGMDDYIPKPVSRKELLHLLDTYLDAVGDGSEDEKMSSDGTSTEEDSVQNYDLFAAASAIGISAQRMHAIVSAGLGRYGTDIEQLRAHLQNEDYEEIRKIAHKLKGAFLNLRIDSLAAIAEKIQNAVESGENFDYPKAIGQLDSKLAEFNAYINSEELRNGI